MQLIQGVGTKTAEALGLQTHSKLLDEMRSLEFKYILI